MAPVSKKDLLVEIGTEEMPPGALQTLGMSFMQGIETALVSRELAHGDASWYATPRRLAVIIRKVQSRQADREVLKRGPALNAAYDKDGKPTRAAEGFAGSCGVSVDELDVLDTDKGKWLSYNLKEEGQVAHLDSHPNRHLILGLALLFQIGKI